MALTKITGEGLGSLGTGNLTHGSDSGDTRFTLNSANQYTLVLKNAGNIAGQIGGSGSDVLRFSNAAGATIMEMNAGQITKPLQPAFSATVGTTQSNPSSSSRVAFNSEVFDQNADYDPSIYVFTAPVTGKYFLSISIRLDQPDTAADFIRFNIVTSNRGYNSSIFDLGNLSGDPNYWNMQTAVLADMDAGDTAEVEIIYAGGAAQADISTESFFSGCLVC